MSSTIGIKELSRLGSDNFGGVYGLPQGVQEWHDMPHDYYAPGVQIVGNSHGVAVVDFPRGGGLRVYWSTPKAGRVLSATLPAGTRAEDITVEIAAKAVHDMLCEIDRKYQTGYFAARIGAAS